MIFTDKIKLLRTEHQLTQRQVAADLGIDVAMYNRFEKGERKMKRQLVVALANFYQVPKEELLKSWLAGQVYTLLSKEGYAKDVINMVAEDMSMYNKKKRAI